MTSLIVFLIMSLHGLMASGYDLRDITSLVFGKDENSFVPAAFGDFNSDKLTDIFVLKEDQKSVAVLLASEQNVVSVDSSPVFQYQHNMQCGCPGGESGSSHNLHLSLLLQAANSPLLLRQTSMETAPWT